MPAEVTQTTEDPPIVDPAAPPAPPVDKPAVSETTTPPGDEKGENAAPKTALEAAQRVMAKEGKKTSEAKPQDGTQPPKVADGEKPPKTEFDDPNLPFKDHPDYKRWASEHRSLKLAKTKNEEALRTLEPKAKAHDDLTQFFTDSRLGPQDVTDGLRIMKAIRNDPAQAVAMLAPIWERLQLMTGSILPPDLQAKVTAGTLDAEAAQELAKARADAGLANSRAADAEQRRARETEEREREVEEGAVGTVVEALNQWGKDWAARDPDAAKKQPLLEKMLRSAWSENPPRTPQEAREQADAVLEEFNQGVRSFVPAPQPKVGNLPVGGAPNHSAPVPKTALEAAQMALRATRGA